MKIRICLSATVFIVVCNQALRAQDYEMFPAKYGKEAPSDLRTPVVERKNSWHADADGGPDVPMSIDAFTAVTDSKKLLFQIQQTGTGTHTGKKYKMGGYISEDVSFEVSFDNDDNGRISGNLHVPWNAKHTIHIIALYLGYYLPIEWPLYRLYIGHGPNRYFRPNPATNGGYLVAAARSNFLVRHETRNGTDCVVIRQESADRQPPQDVVYYLDAQTYMVLAHETDRRG